MGRHDLIVAQSLEFFGQGIVLLIGILVLLFFSGIVLVTLYVGLRVWVFRRRQQRAKEEYLRRTRRADGKMYPPRGGGICEQCGRVRKVVYFVSTGERLCHKCYEAWWPTAEHKQATTPSVAEARVARSTPRAAEAPLARAALNSHE